jgi:hypothetical protein
MVFIYTGGQILMSATVISSFISYQKKKEKKNVHLKNDLLNCYDVHAIILCTTQHNNANFK